MRDARRLDRLIDTVLQALPGGTQDLEKNLRAALQDVFERLDLVTREELEVQEAVLARTRERLKELEKKISELEERVLKRQSHGGTRGA